MAPYVFEMRKRYWREVESYLILVFIGVLTYLLFTQTSRRPSDFLGFAAVSAMLLGANYAVIRRALVAVDETTLYTRDLDIGRKSMPRSDILGIQEHDRYWVVYGRSGEMVWIRLGWPRRQLEELARVLGVPLVLLRDPEWTREPQA